MPSSASALPLPADLVESIDHRVVLHGVSWEDFERILRMRGDRAVPRLTYLEGELELTRPSYGHEWTRKCFARLVGIYCLERGIDITGMGSWTLRRRKKERAVEPDECYVLGDPAGRRVPDFAIEVMWSPGGLDKLEIHRGLGVREVWLWKSGRIVVQALGPNGYSRVPASQLVPELDLEIVARLVRLGSQTEAIHRLLDQLRRKPRKKRRPR